MPENVLNILVIEDNADDAGIIIRVLEKSGMRISHKRIYTEKGFRSSLKSSEQFDIILSDYNLPSFKGTQAFRIMKDEGLDIPFILITGTLEDGIASELVNIGLDDYILKDRLGRLPNAIQTAIEKQQLRDRNISVSKRAKLSEDRYKALTKVSPVGIFQMDLDERCEFVNEKFCELTGVSKKKILPDGWFDLIHLEDQEAFQLAWKELVKLKADVQLEFRFMQPAGKVVWVLGQFVCLYEDDQVTGYMGSVTDITQQKKTLESLNMHLNEVSGTEKINSSVLRGDPLPKVADLILDTLDELTGVKSSRIYQFNQSNNSFQSIAEHIEKGYIQKVEERVGIKVSNAKPQLTPESIFTDIINKRQIIITSDVDEIKKLMAAHVKNLFAKKMATWGQQFLDINTFGVLPLFEGDQLLGLITFSSSDVLTQDRKNTIIRFMRMASTVIAKKKADEAMRAGKKRLRRAQQIAQLGYWELNLKSKEMIWSQEMCKIYGFSAPDSQYSFQEWISFLHEDDRDRVLEELEKARGSTGDTRMVYRILREDGEVRYITSQIHVLSDASGNQLASMSAVIYDTTERRKAELERDELLENLELKVKQRTEELTITNKMLEEANKDLTDSINYAERLQRSVLPNKQLLQDHFSDSFIYFRPRDVVSGDLYWFHNVSDSIVVVVADCTGHGVPGAFMSILGTELLNKHVIDRGLKFPSNILEQLKMGLNETLKKAGGEVVNDGMDISICTIDKKRNRFHFAGAGRPIIWLSNGELKYIRGEKFGLGNSYSNVTKEFETQTFSYAEGDMIYMFSDGYADQFGGDKGRKFMTSRFQKMLLDVYEKSGAEQEKLLEDQFISWMGDLAQVDDVLVMGLRL